MMGESFPYFDIVFLAMVAAFILLRLMAVLGRRTGHEKPGTKGLAAPTSPPAKDDKAPEKPAKTEADVTTNADSDAKKGLAAIAAKDPSFSTESFCSGAAMAFETIITAFAAGQKKSLKPLLTNTVYNSFAEAIDARKKAGETMETALVSLDDLTVRQASLDARGRAEITVKFKSQQVNITKDKKGEVINGNPEYVEEVTDLWVFSRNVASRNPNWLLAATLDP